MSVVMRVNRGVAKLFAAKKSQIRLVYSGHRVLDVECCRHLTTSVVTHQAAKIQEKTPIPPPSYYTKPISPAPGSTVNKFASLRSHNCGELTAAKVGQKVRLAGWIQYRRMGGKILILRDAYGMTQVIFPDSVIQEEWGLDKQTLESVVSVSGTVTLRPTGQANPSMSTGDIEIVADNFELLNPANNSLPFMIRDHNKAKEALRMQYRYLDLRFPNMQSKLRLRSAMLIEMRRFLAEKCGFVEVETPTLFRRTPGGAQEFVVPSRIPGQCYTLVQSPQQFKQLLMVGGIDRYFQIARCYRDESARPDRQPEFTQLDIEMSFGNQQGVMDLSEQLVSECWRATVQPQLPQNRFPVMKYKDAMELYGTDKPDTRFEMLIKNLKDSLKSMTDVCSPHLKSAISDEKSYVGAIIVPGGHAVWSSSTSLSKQLDEIKEHIDSPVWLRGFKIPYEASAPWPIFGEDPKVTDILKNVLGPVTKHGDIVWMAAGQYDDSLTALGRLRVASANKLENAGIPVRSQGPNFLWLVDFPLFVPGEVPGTLSPAHHPFTQAHPEDAHLMFSDPLKVRGLHYDLVLDGWEVAGGSVRIHNSEVQRKVLQELLGVEADSLHHLLDGLASGCPPHAGIAFGIDRLVAVACGAASIRDVIAFPKAIGGRDPMSGAPCPMTEADQQLYHVRCAQPSPNS